MEVLILTVFCSLVLALVGIAFFAWTVREQTFDHSERLSLLPLDDDPPATPPACPQGDTVHAEDSHHLR